jgi:5-methylcytosine-specific restriction endonuclease McrA
VVELLGLAENINIVTDMKKSRRHFVFERDGFKCKVCGTGEDLTLDHIQPRSKGGSDLPNNLQTLCKGCNEKKGDRYKTR